MGAALKLERTQQPHAPPTPTLPSQTSSAPVVGLSGVLAGLSHALDLAEGQPPGHTIRTCVIGMRLGEALGLNSEDRSALYYALLLKDAG